MAMMVDDDERLPTRMRIQRVRCEQAAMQFRFAALTFYFALKRHELRAYNPNQLRVPAGNPDGGQWTDGGFHLLKPRYDSGRPQSEENARVAGGDDDAWRYSVRLEDEEAPQGIGHAIRDHVGKSDDELLNDVRRQRFRFLGLTFYRFANGSFATAEAANDFVNRTLEGNSALVDRVATGTLIAAPLDRRFGYPTGKEAYTSSSVDEPYIRKTYGARVVIRHDRSSPRGYRVLTAFPINDDPRR